MASKPFYNKFGFYRKDGKLWLDPEQDILKIREEVAKGNKTAIRSAQYLKRETVKSLKSQIKQAENLIKSGTLNYIQTAVANQLIREANKDIEDLNGADYAKKLTNIHSRQFTSSDSFDSSRLKKREVDYIANYVKARVTGAGFAGSYGEISGEEFDAVERACKIAGIDFNKIVHDEVIKQDYVRGTSQLYRGMGEGYATAVHTLIDTLPELTDQQLEEIASISNLEREIISDIYLKMGI